MQNAMILAAGRGERLKPLTDTIPKALIPVGEHRLIEYHLIALAKAGVLRVVINCAHLSEQFKPVLGDGTQYGLEIVYSYEPKALETGGGIYQALPLLGAHPFIVVNGDIWTDFDFSLLPSQIAGTAHLVLVQNPTHHPDGDFVLQQDGFIGGVGEKLTYSGIGVYTPAFFKNCRAGHFPLAPLIHEAAQAKRVTGEKAKCTWIDVGTHERLQEAVRVLTGQCRPKPPAHA